MKRFIKSIVSAVLIAAMTTAPTFAAGRQLTANLAGGCKTTVTVKRAKASNVRHDGIISPGEYEEIPINRNTDLDSSEPLSDILLTGENQRRALEKCRAILETTHFYMSWDEIHGLNIGVEVTYPETPYSDENYQPDNTYYPDQDFPGDEFLFQFGLMFKTVVGGKNSIYRGISKQTKTGELLYGHYGVHGLTGVLEQTPHEDYEVRISGNTVTYEISFPMESLLAESSRNGTIPENGEKIEFTLSVVGGNQGKMHSNSNAYAISIGDGGYMVSWGSLGKEKSNAFAVFSTEEINNDANPPEEPHEHSYGEWKITKEPSCTVTGLKERSCVICGEHEKQDISITDHSWGEWQIVKEATENEEGLRRRSCLICGETENSIIAPLSHQHIYTETITAPTCTEQGYTTYTCICGDRYNDSFADAEGHSYTDTVSAPTCTLKGFTTHICTKCNDRYSDGDIPALNHSYSERWTVKSYPARDNEGIRYKICTRCSVKDEQMLKKLQNSSLIFDDITADWYKPWIDYAVTRNLMNGKGSGKFSPDEKMTRAEFATVLWRIAGSPESKSNVPFTDLDKNADWYLTAVEWAYENEIIKGTSPDKFEPNGNIKRQDMAVIMHRYAENYKRFDVSASADLTQFPDCNTVGTYAVNAVSWANSLGIITGKDGNIAPIEPGTRAEVAAILTRFDLIH